MELAPAPVTCSAGDFVSHAVLRVPPDVEQPLDVVAACGAGGVVVLTGAAVVVGAAVAALVVVVGLVVAVVVVVVAFLAADGDDELHDAATRAAAARPRTMIDVRVARSRGGPAGSPGRTELLRTPRRTNAPLPGLQGPAPCTAPHGY
jgi:hypothetical protein